MITSTTDEDDGDDNDSEFVKRLILNLVYKRIHLVLLIEHCIYEIRFLFFYFFAHQRLHHNFNNGL